MKVIILICFQLVNYAQSYDPKWSVGKCRRVFGLNCERKPSWFVCNCNSNCFSNNTLFLENSLPGTVNSPAACQIRCKYTKGCKVNTTNFHVLHTVSDLISMIRNVLISFSLGHQLQGSVDFDSMIQVQLSCLQDKQVVMWN